MGCLNLTKKLILKYLIPSPATKKGHVKRPHHGIKGTQPKLTPRATHPDQPVVIKPPHDIGAAPVHGVLLQQPLPHLIDDNGDESIANVFCFGAFVACHSGVVYNNLTGKFPFMLFDGSVSYLVMYHYKSNAILATPITGLDDVSIFNEYKLNFDELLKGYKSRLNVMDNQATKQFLTKEECKLQLVEPHNHTVNAAKHAIQTFKDVFIAALAMTDRDFSLQLWDKLMPQVINMLNML
jgi:hypothetical protein